MRERQGFLRRDYVPSLSLQPTVGAVGFIFAPCRGYETGKHATRMSRIAAQRPRRDRLIAAGLSGIGDELREQVRLALGIEGG
jgi:hypothetical protein